MTRPKDGQDEKTSSTTGGWMQAMSAMDKQLQDRLAAFQQKYNLTTHSPKAEDTLSSARLVEKKQGEGNDDDDDQWAQHQLQVLVEQNQTSLLQHYASHQRDLDEFQHLEEELLLENEEDLDAEYSIRSKQDVDTIMARMEEAGEDYFSLVPQPSSAYTRADDDFTAAKEHDHIMEEDEDDVTIRITSSHSPLDCHSNHDEWDGNMSEDGLWAEKKLLDESFHPLMLQEENDRAGHTEDCPATLPAPWSTFPSNQLVTDLFNLRISDPSEKLDPEPEETIPKVEAISEPSVPNPVVTAQTIPADILALQEQVKSLLEQVSRAKSLESKKAAEFEAYRTSELARIQDLQTSASKSIRQERLQWEKQRKAAELLPTKRERVELEAMKTQIAAIRVEFRDEKSRLLLTQDRFKRKVEELKRANQELSEQVKVLERERGGLLEVVSQLKTAKGSAQKTSMSVGGMVGSVPSSGSRGPMVKSNSMLSSKGNSKSKVSPSTKASVNTWVPSNSVPLVEKVDPSTWALDDMQVQLELPHAIETKNHSDGRVERIYKNGTTLVHHPNGSIKQTGSDGNATIHFTNGDTRSIQPNGDLHYYYAAQKTWHSTLVSEGGVEVFRFVDGQIERRYPDGSSHITFPDETVRVIFANGEEECSFPDGRVAKIDKGRKKITRFPDGSEETNVNGVRTKHYPNGVVRIVFANGTRETRLPDGRVRIQDRHGNILCNTG